MLKKVPKLPAESDKSVEKDDQNIDQKVLILTQKNKKFLLVDGKTTQRLSGKATAGRSSDAGYTAVLC